MRKYKVIYLTGIFSIVFHIFIRDVEINIAIGSISFQLICSAVLGYIVSMYVAKYKKNDWTFYWKIIYVIMVFGFALVHFLNVYPS